MLKQDGPIENVGLERLAFVSFFKKYYKFRNGDINMRFKEIPDDIQLPQKSCLHLLDNMYAQEHGLPYNDTPNLNIPFVTNETFKKYILHIKNLDVFNPELPITINSKYQYLNAGLEQNIKKFNSVIRSQRWFVINHIPEIPSIPNALTVVNYNPLFRVNPRGTTIPQYEKFRFIFGTLLNTVSQINDKQNYIMIPLGKKIYAKDMFKRTEKIITATTLKSKTDFHYFFMLHWLNFINVFTSNSLLASYPEDKWGSTVFVFYYGKYYMFWSLKDIIELNFRNKTYNRHVNQINALVLNGIGAEINDEATTEEIEEISKINDVEVEHDEELLKEEEKNASILQITNTPAKTTSISNDSSIIQKQKQVDFLNNTVSDLVSQLGNILKLIPSDITAPAISNFKYNVINSNSSIQEDQEEPVNDGTVLIKDVEQEITQDNLSEYTVSAEVKKMVPDTTGQQVADAGVSFIKDIDTQSEQAINDSTLTLKQKIRAKQLSLAYKSIPVNGKTLEEQITAIVDPGLAKNTVNQLDTYVPDKSMINSSIQTFDKDYMNKYYIKDLVETAVSFNTKGMFLIDIQQSITSDELNRTVDCKFIYEDLKGKRHNIKFTIPHIAEDGTCLVNGVRSYLRKQMTNLPICKVSPTRVSLASNYNKTVIEKNVTKAHSFLPYFQRVINTINKSTDNCISLEYGVLSLNTKLAYEYTEIASLYKTIHFSMKNVEVNFVFDFDNRFLSTTRENQLRDIETQFGTYIGTTIESGITYECFMHTSNLIYFYNSKQQRNATTILDMFISIFDVKLSSQLTEWTDIKILDKKFPIGFLLCYKYGITHILNYLNIPYKLTDLRYKEENSEVKVSVRPSDIVLRFADKKLIIPRYPLRNSLIISGLDMFNVAEYSYSDFDKQDIYYQLLTDKGPQYKINYLKGIDDTFSLFVDPMTKDVLRQMNEPQTFKDLLIRATDMLTDTEYREAASMYNHRLRTYERLNAILYNEMARQFAKYNRRKGAGSTFSINPNAVLLRILQDQAMISVEDINPVHDIKTFTGFTYTGMGGRTQESFVVNDRRFPEDAIGIISEATADSGNVALTANTTMDPTIANARGILISEDKKELEPTQILSVSALLMPGVTQDDRYDNLIYIS